MREPRAGAGRGSAGAAAATFLLQGAPFASSQPHASNSTDRPRSAQNLISVAGYRAQLPQSRFFFFSSIPPSTTPGLRKKEGVGWTMCQPILPCLAAIRPTTGYFVTELLQMQECLAPAGDVSKMKDTKHTISW
ncbi:hypothetical protein CRV24_005227 [Beauveria bassiana]|nr:hypothetical protein CRV24_005227 [Beauveria bassiana]